MPIGNIPALTRINCIIRGIAPQIHHALEISKAFGFRAGPTLNQARHRTIKGTNRYPPAISFCQYRPTMRKISLDRNRIHLTFDT